MKFNKYLLVSIGIYLVSAPLARAAGLVPCEGTDCKFCHLFQLAEKIINFLVEISFAIAIIWIIWGGLKIIFAGANPGLAASGRKTILQAIIGLVILLCSWLIIDTILWVLTGSTSIENWGPWNTINCV